MTLSTPPNHSKMTGSQILLVLLIVFGAVLTAVFALRAYRSYMHLHRMGRPPLAQHDASLIRDWMTIPFVARMYHVPEFVIFDGLGISPASHRSRNLAQINAELFPHQTGEATRRVIEIVKQYQANAPAGTLTPPAPP